MDELGEDEEEESQCIVRVNDIAHLADPDQEEGEGGTKEAVPNDLAARVKRRQRRQRSGTHQRWPALSLPGHGYGTYGVLSGLVHGVRVDPFTFAEKSHQGDQR